MRNVVLPVKTEPGFPCSSTQSWVVVEETKDWLRLYRIDELGSGERAWDAAMRTLWTYGLGCRPKNLRVWRL